MKSEIINFEIKLIVLLASDNKQPFNLWIVDKENKKKNTQLWDNR